VNAPEGAVRAWSIAEVERETGLAKDTLRVWERRYGFPTPERDAQGERSYDDAQVQRLRWLKHLLDQGHRPGQVVALPLHQVRAMAEAAPAPKRADAGAAPAPLDPRWMQALCEHDLDALRRALHLHTLQHGLLSTVEEVIAPLAAAVGQAWSSGTLSVYQEHLFSEAVEASLREAMAGMATTQASLGAPRVLLTTLPGESHTLGLLMAESVLALQGCERLPLGASTPLGEIVLAAERLRADVVAIGVSARAAPLPLRRDLQLLRERLPAAVALWVGGPVRSALGRRPLPGVTPVLQASDLLGLVAEWRGR
jgi:DNA-binding transcriptional MerR regulator/methylmalonyl-CoA mutase cobalamin-binding subunit